MPEEIPPAIAVACARFAEWSELRKQTDRLESRLEDRVVIDQAKDLLMRVRGVSEDDAYRTLRRESQNRNRTMAEIARTLLAAEALFRDPVSS
jgi:two-component system, response regulator / RNA-binding antiterminator